MNVEILMPLRVLDLFSGIGGFSLGLERAGMQTVAFCEIDKKARLVLKKHWPDVPIFEDVKALTKETLDEKGISVDVICGGFPCQDISLAGKGAGLEGERSGLWWEFHRLIKEIRPQWVIAENVSALRSRGLDQVLRSLSEIGYDAEWHCIPASAIGAPHRRDRIWIVAYPAGKGLSKWRRSEWEEGATQADTRLVTEFKRCSQNVADTGGAGLQRNEWFGQAGKEGQSPRHLAECSWWAIEPDMGGRLDGFSAWLDRFDFSVAHKLLLAHGEKEIRAREELFALRGHNAEETIWKEIRGLERISPSEILFTYMRQLKKRASDETWLQLSCQKISETGVRSMWDEYVASRPSHRPKHSKQCASEYTDFMQALSQLLAQHAEKAWVEYCGQNAIPRGWEEGISRTAHGVFGRVDRLKQLGNAVVPQISEMIGRAILEITA